MSYLLCTSCRLGKWGSRLNKLPNFAPLISLWQSGGLDLGFKNLNLNMVVTVDNGKSGAEEKAEKQQRMYMVTDPLSTSGAAILI